MSLERRWVEQSPDATIVERLCEQVHCSEHLATILVNRGVTDPETARQFLSPSAEHLHEPTDLPDFQPATDRLLEAIDTGEQVLVFGDRDVDGLSGCAILVALLDDLGCPVGWYIPRKYDGYGLNETAVESIRDRGTDLLVTVDCGTTATEAIATLTRACVDVIVTDHHEPEVSDTEAPPESERSSSGEFVAHVNPRLPDSEYPHPNLAAGAIAYKLGYTLLERQDPDSLPSYEDFALPLATVATIGDYVQLNTENRAIAVEGFERLLNCPLPGLADLVDHCDVTDIRDVSWDLVPLLNATQEDDSGNLGMQVLLAPEEDARTEFHQTIEDYRETRRENRRNRIEHIMACFHEQVIAPGTDAENQTTDDATTDTDTAERIIFVETDRYVGSAAMHTLSERTGLPVIAYRADGDQYVGGGRSDPDVDFIDLFEQCEELLSSYWGHPGAAGFRLPAERIDIFETRIREVIARTYDPEELLPTIDIDCHVDITAIDEGLLEELADLRPFGPGNEEPRFLVEDVCIASVEAFGSDDQHLRLQPEHVEDLQIVFWDGASEQLSKAQGATFDIVGKLEWDDYANCPRISVADLQGSNGWDAGEPPELT